MGKCYNTIEIKAPVNKVWDTIRDFHDLVLEDGAIPLTQLAAKVDRWIAAY